VGAAVGRVFLGIVAEGASLLVRDTVAAVAAKCRPRDDDDQCADNKSRAHWRPPWSGHDADDVNVARGPACSIVRLVVGVPFELVVAAAREPVTARQSASVVFGEADRVVVESGAHVLDSR
jgi:hypothetical protein